MPFSYRPLEGFVPWAAFWPLDRNGPNLTSSHAGPSLLAATPTILRGTQSLDTAVYWSLTSCHSTKTPNNSETGSSNSDKLQIGEEKGLKKLFLIIDVIRPSTFTPHYLSPNGRSVISDKRRVSAMWPGRSWRAARDGFSDLSSRSVEAVLAAFANIEAILRAQCRILSGADQES
jgi:hypothetical protein